MCIKVTVSAKIFSCCISYCRQAIVEGRFATHNISRMYAWGICAYKFFKLNYSSLRVISDQVVSAEDNYNYLSTC